MSGIRAGMGGLVVVAVMVAAPLAVAGDPGAITIESNPLGSSHGLTYRGATYTKSAASNAYVAAVCPGAKVLAGGGGDDGDTSNNTWIHVAGPDWFPTEVPPSARKAFTTGIHSESANPVNAASFAICAARKGLHMYVKDKGTTVQDEPFGARARCKHHSSVTGGGFYGEGNADETLVSAPFDGKDADDLPDDGWSAKVRASQTDRTMHVYALCSKQMDLVYRQKDKNLNLGTSLNVNCPDGRAVSGGGAAITQGTNGRLRKSVPADDNDAGSVPDNRWTGAATGGVLISSHFTAYAICKK
jgi:hypothetical protein